MSASADQRRGPQPSASSEHIHLVLVFCIVFSLGAYCVLRYSARWAESDSSELTGVIRAFAEAGRLVPDGEAIYPNGVTYQAVSAVILALTGLDPLTLQQVVYPLLAAVVTVPAWMFYREVVGSARGATLATLLLFAQPEFLFVMLRSSHEKFSRSLMLLALYLFVRSFKLYRQPLALVCHIVLSYPIVFALAAANNLLAHSFLISLAVTLALATGLRLLRCATPEATNEIIRRLGYTVFICLCLIYIFTFALYPPAARSFELIKDVGTQVSAMMLDGEEPTDLPEEAPPPPSSPPVSGWTSRLVYLLVSAGNWLVMLISLITFAALGLRWLLRYGGPEPDRWLIWLLYAAFALQGAISIVVDASGALSGNLALRIFPSFSLIAVGMVASLPDTFHPGRLRGAVAALLGALTAVLIVLAILKATNEPILSNKWIFYGPGELAALRWADTHNQGADIWSEFDERLSVAYYAAYGDSARGNRVIGYRSETTRDAMLSLITRLRAARIGAAAPVPPDALCIYDNGEAQIYHFRPSTPFQR